MEPRIQYAKTNDGVNIAYWTLGNGRPLVYLPHPPRGHIELEWRIPQVRSWYERLAEKTTLVRYDSRGSGLSDRSVTDFSLEALQMDLEAVVDRLGFDRFAVFGRFSSGPIAIAYSARCASRVSHLILWSPYARGSDYLASPRVRALRSLLEKDWELFTESWALWSFGWASPELGRQYANLVREAVTPEAARAGYRAIQEFDVTDLLPTIESPTLVLHRRQVDVPSLEVSAAIAAEIPASRLAILEGRTGAVYHEDSDSVLRVIYDFLGETSDSPAHAHPPRHDTTLILFADIVDSTALTEQMGDAAFRGKARELDASLRAIILEHNGTPIEGKLLGDGVLATFAGARQAIQAALACEKAGDEFGLALHLGIHAGDVIREQNNVYGGAVNIAARIAGASASGEVLVSQTVRDLARTSAGVRFEDRGRRALRGVEGRQRLFEVRREPGPSGGEP